LSDRPSFRSLQDSSQNLTVLSFRASSVSGSQLLQRQGNIFIDIANYKIGSHIDLLTWNH